MGAPKAPPLEYLLMVAARIYRLFATLGIMLAVNASVLVRVPHD